MNILELARRDYKNIITNKTSGFAVDILFIPPAGSSVTVQGLHSRHNLAIDLDGKPANSRQMHISVAESSLTDAGYTVRDANNEVQLRGHKVQVADASGEDITYKVRSVMPDDTIGNLLIILDDYKA